METFKTQFMMSGVRTDATITLIENKTFGIVLNLMDFFEGEEIPGNEDNPDAIITFSKEENWEIKGKSKINLSKEDLENLGKAIEEDYLKHLK